MQPTLELARRPARSGAGRSKQLEQSRSWRSPVPVEWTDNQALAPEALLVLAPHRLSSSPEPSPEPRLVGHCAVIVSYLAAASFSPASLAFSRRRTLSGPIVIDPMSLGLRWLALLVGFVFTLVAARWPMKISPANTSAA